MAASCAGNILLATTSMMPHGFSAKVSDFGMAREMDIQSKIATATTGTVTYMPPETIADGMVSKVRSCDAQHIHHSSQGLARNGHALLCRIDGLCEEAIVWVPIATTLA